MDPQRRAIALGKAYEEIWECDRPAPVMEAPPGGFPRDWIPPISIQTLREVAKTFRRDRAVSLDNLRPKHVELLSGDALESLVALFHVFERFGDVAGCLSNLICFIPKATSGERAIGTILAIYALYEAARLDQLQGWMREMRGSISGLVSEEGQMRASGRSRCMLKPLFPLVLPQ